MTARSGRKYRGFLERTTDGLREAVERVAYAEHKATSRGLLQKIDPRVKVAGLFALVLAATISGNLRGIALAFAFAVAMALLSRLSPLMLASRVWLAALAFSGVIALPACFLTPGVTLLQVPVVNWPVTRQGVMTAAYLILRVEAAATLVSLLVFTTPWSHVLRALRSLRAPLVLVVIVGMTYRYILLLLETAHEMFESRRSRLVGRLDGKDRRRLAVATAGVLLGKTMHYGNDVYLAMQARGFRGDVYLLDRFRMRRHDWAALVVFGAMTVTAIWAGR